VLSSLLREFGNWIAGHQEAFIAAIGLLGAIVTWGLDHRLRRRQLLYRVQMDTGLHLAPGIRQSVAEIAVRVNGREVTDPTVALIRLTNTGSLPIRQEDFIRPLSFTFKGRTVVGYEVAENDEVANQLAVEAAPPAQPPRESIWSRLGDVIFGGGKPRDPDAGISADPPNDRLVLSTFDLEQRKRFKLLVVLSGNDKGVEATTALRNGKLVRDLAGNGPSRRTIIYGGIVAVLVGALVAIVSLGPTTRKATPDVTCVKGTITVVGSTAFRPAVNEIAADYEHTCPGATITVNATGSVAGITELETGKHTDEIALYDGSPPSGAYADLTGERVAAVVFAVVVNVSTDVHNLTVNQLQDIFSGKDTNWNQVSSSLPNLPITVVGRDS